MVREIVVVLVTPPPVPVIVMVKVPVVAPEVTLIIIAAVPAPGAGIVEGLNATLTPVGTPEAVNATAELNPPETVVVILAWPCAPRATDTLAGAAAIVKVPVGPVTVRLTVVVSVVLPAVPVTVMV